MLVPIGHARQLLVRHSAGLKAVVFQRNDCIRMSPRPALYLMSDIAHNANFPGLVESAMKMF